MMVRRLFGRSTTPTLLYIVGVLLVLAQGQVARAAVVTVTTSDDELNSDGDCSLREAVQAANTDTAVDACPAGSGSDTIILPAGIYSLSIPGADETANATGDLNITAAVRINGPGAATTIIDGAGLDRVFHIAVGVTVEISGLTIQNGALTDYGGGLFNQGTLTVTNSIIASNSSSSSGGGAIRNDGTISLTNSMVSGNSANTPKEVPPVSRSLEARLARRNLFAQLGPSS